MKRLIAIALGCAVAAGSASASVVVNTVSLGSHESTTGSLSFNVLVPKFDTTLGTLTGIDVQMNVQSLNSLTSPAAVGGTVVDGDVTSQFKWTVNGGDSASVVSPADHFDKPFPMRIPPKDLTHYADASHSLLAAGSANSVSSLAYLSGTGSGSESIAIDYLGSYTGASNLKPGSKFDGDLKVTYTYETAAVPEPATFAIFGVGLVGLISRRKR